MNARSDEAMSSESTTYTCTQTQFEACRAACKKVREREGVRGEGEGRSREEEGKVDMR